MISRDTQFQSENFLMSVLGHLVLIAIMMLSFSLVVERAKLVTPNRIQIIEIDLKNVKVSGDETKLYNTNQIQPEKDEKIDKKSREGKNIEIKKSDLKQPTMLENESKDSSKEKSSKKDKKNIEDKPAPRKKTVVRVNREVLSLDRTMTVSVIDALRVALTRCWNIDTTHPGIEDIRLTAHIKFLPTGVVDRLWFESESRAETDPDFAYVLDTAKSAIKTCSPFSMLPRNEYDKWRDTSVTFYPTSGKVM
jgi:hypothetical protein